MDAYQHDLYLIDVYDSLVVDGGTLKIGDEFYPIKSVRSIVVYGQYSLTTSVLALFAKHGIVCHCFNYYGNYIGTYYPMDNRNISRLLVSQYALVSNKKQLLKFQKMAVREFCKTGQSLLRYYKRKGVSVSVPKMITNEQPLIMEALNKQQYYVSLENIFKIYGYIFEKRSYRPPHNIVNSLMSFFNAMLYKDILNGLYRFGLDPKISMTHAISTRRAHALEYDLSDFLRPVLVDRLIITLLKKNKVTEDMFQTDNGYYLKSTYIKELIQYYQHFMQEEYGYTFGSLTGYQLINEHIRQFQVYLKDGTPMKGARLR